MPDTGDVDAGAASPARRKAEAAFAASGFQARPISPTQVTVRRARLAVLAKPDRTDEAPREPAPHPKRPRVFRVDVARSGEPPDPSPHAIAATAPADRGFTVPATPKRRVAADKRPGPVLRVVQAPTERPQRRPAAQPKSETVIAALAGIDPVLQAIQRAQSFIFIDDRFDKPWRQLSRRAGTLLAELKARRR